MATINIGFSTYVTGIAVPSDVASSYEQEGSYTSGIAIPAAVAAAPASTTSLISVPRRHTPSYKAGYARCASESANPNLWDGLVGAWIPAMGVTGNTLRDLAGSNHGTLTNMDPATDWVVTEKGYTLLYDGDNDSVVISDNDAYDFGTGEFTTISEIYSDGSTIDGACNIVSKGATGGAEWMFRIAAENNPPTARLSFYGDAGSINATAGDGTWVADGWHVVAARRTGTAVTVYRDGVSHASDTSAGASLDNATDLAIGGVTARFWAGNIGATLIYNRSLTNNELAQLTADPLAPFRQRSLVLAYSTAAAEETTTALISVPRRHTPSYKAGYARNAAESANPNLWDSLIGCWSPELGNTGGVLHDLANRNNGDIATNMDPATDWEVDEKGWSLDFNGTNDYIIIDNEPFWDGDMMNRTLMMWVNIDNSPSTDYELMSKGGGAPNGFEWWVLYGVSNNGNVKFLMNSITVTATTQIPDSSGWHHLAVVLNTSSLTFYLDGVEDNTETMSYAGDNATNFIIGSRTGASKFFKGNIGLTQVYDRPLRGREIQQLYQDPLAPFRQRDLVVAYPTTTPAATTTALISVPRRHTPSFKAGYARCAAESANPNLWDSLVGAWVPAMGYTGLSIRDLSGRKNHGICTNMLPIDSKWAMTENGWTIDYDGSNDRVIADGEDYTTSSRMQMCCWMKCGDSAGESNEFQQTFLSWGDTGDAFAATVNLNGTVEVYTSGGNTGTNTSIIVDDDAWHFVLCQWDQPATILSIWVDGALDYQDSSYADTSSSTGGTFEIGARTTGSMYFVGGVGSVYAHTKISTPNEIQQLYQDPLAPFRQRDLVLAYSTAAAPATGGLQTSSLSLLGVGI